MDQEKYEIFKSKVLGAEKKMMDAFEKFDDELEEIVKVYPSDEMFELLGRAKRDDRISAGLYKQIAEAFLAKHSKVGSINLPKLLQIIAMLDNL